MHISTSTKNRCLGGVCGGLGQSFGISVALLRCIFVFLFLFSGGLLACTIYVFIWLILPKSEPGPSVHPKALSKSRKEKIFLGVVGGMSQCFKLDPSLLRVISIIIIFVTGIVPGLALYLLMGTTLPYFMNEPSLSVRRLFREKNKKVLAGVCSGLAFYYRVSPNSIRVIFCVLALFTAVIPMCVLYLLSIFIIPQRPYEGEIL